MNDCLVEQCSKKVVAKQLCQFHYDRKRRYGDLRTRPSELSCINCSKMFSVSKTGNLPLRCEPCQIDYHRTQMRLDRHRKGIWELYKITTEQYQAMHDEQGGVCLICQQTTKGRGQANNRLAVDHDHKTKKIRGLLCSHCNTALGLFRDNVQYLESAINYLKEKG